MRTVVTLSFDSKIYVDMEPVVVYMWVRVTSNQIPPGGEELPMPPELIAGKVYRFKLPGEGEVSLKSVGRGLLRKLSSSEDKFEVIQITRDDTNKLIRLGIDKKTL